MTTQDNADIRLPGADVLPAIRSRAQSFRESIASERFFEEDVEEPTGTVISSTTNLANTILGSGMLSMPNAMASLGLALGSLVIMFSAFTSGMGLYLLSRCARRTGGRDSSFFAVSKLTYPKAAVFFDAAIAIKCFGVSISYLIIFGDLMPEIVEAFGFEIPLLLSRSFWITFAIVALIPLAFQRRLDALKYTSMTALIAVVYLIAVVAIFYFSPTREPLPAGDVAFFKWSKGFFTHLPVFVFAFTCHQNIFSVYNELRDNSSKQVNGVIALSMGSACAAYQWIAILGELKVADLRKELTARNLPANGLKKDLVERLEEALRLTGDSAPATPDQTTEEISPPVPATSDNDIVPDESNEAEETQKTNGDNENSLKRKSEDDGIDMNVDDFVDTEDKDVEPTSHQADASSLDNSGNSDLCALYLKNLERPLTAQKLEEFLNKYGKSDKVWLNSIKTRGYASFVSSTDAKTTFESINGTQFHPEHGKLLECGLITKARMEELINDEEANNDTVLTNDIVTVPVEGSNCGVAFQKPDAKNKGKNASKKQRTEKSQGQEQGQDAGKSSKIPEKTISIVAAAANAAAEDTRQTVDKASRRDSADSNPEPQNGRKQRNDRRESPLARSRNDTHIQWTKVTPSICFKFLSDSEIAERKLTG
ncbi:hypothetical protein GGI15_002866 [Coemansia interrupta]|uniref:SAP domain-containing protein n=1 Tax=Coemansia interrupta TaxID=1126814 RepID=A0A9W8LJ45_9FUNG|nr:hypothetical protein GGI15_002866 [Coemansia interrupta]